MCARLISQNKRPPLRMACVWLKYQHACQQAILVREPEVRINLRASMIIPPNVTANLSHSSRVVNQNPLRLGIGNDIMPLRTSPPGNYSCRRDHKICRTDYGPLSDRLAAYEGVSQTGLRSTGAPLLLLPSGRKRGRPAESGIRPTPIFYGSGTSGIFFSYSFCPK